MNCDNLENCDTTDDSALTEIQSQALRSKVVTHQHSKTVIIVGNSAFQDSGLKEVVMPPDDGALTTLGPNAFRCR